MKLNGEGWYVTTSMPYPLDSSSTTNVGDSAECSCQGIQVLLGPSSVQLMHMVRFPILRASVTIDSHELA